LNLINKRERYMDNPRTRVAIIIRDYRDWVEAYTKGTRLDPPPDNWTIANTISDIYIKALLES
jgi:hypothetical protein